uniref:Uncharacterized protein n=1 Tax=viral metagenome TaxID=1070528 RepID=A0A6C0I373_9ZZZZ
MIILKNDNITEIVAYMLNFEHNYTVFEPTGELSTDVKKFPLLILPNGHTIHYRPTCGIIYYNKEHSKDRDKDEIIFSKKCEALIEKIYEQISKHEEHLLKERVTAVTGSCAIKHNKFVNGTYMIKSKNPFFRTKKNVDKFPARALILLSNNTYYDNNMPPHYSTRASFTWYFMPMQFDLYIQNMSYANALISSIYIDSEHFTKFPHNTITYNLKYIINFLAIKIKNKLIITEIGNNENAHMQYSMSSCDDKIFEILYFLNYDRINPATIKDFDEINYINDEKKCISCGTANIPFCIAATISNCDCDNEEIDLYYIFCADCWNSTIEIKNIPKKYYYIMPLYNKCTITEIFPKIYSILKEDFYKITPIEFHHHIDAYDKILITNKDLKYVFETMNIIPMDNILDYYIVSFSGSMIF